MTADLTWIGDGWCDDGAFGMYLDCEAFNYDDGDCGHCVDQDANNYGELAACAYDVATCDVEGACNFGEEGDCTFAAEGLDCDGNQLDCVGGMTADLTWIGDGWCDDGAFGMYLDCEAFNYDDGDCGHCVDQDANNYGELAACAYDVATCDVEGACNFGEPGDCTFAAEGLDCDGNQLDCVGGMTADLTWIGDGWCDDGAFGMYLDCEAFNYDDGDCGHCVDQDANNYGELAACAYDVATCDVEGACNFGEPGDCTFAAEGLDCDGNQLDCVGGMTADLTWIGDGWCDDGAFGMYLDCEAFNYDDGDCGHCVDQDANNYGELAACAYDVATCDVEGACNFGEEGDCTFAAEGLDCDGNQLDCVGGMTADLTWIGDGWCDDGAFGMYLDCETFNYDDGDCGHCVDQDANNYGELAACAYDVATCDVEGACNFGEPGDCTFAAEGLDCDGNQLDCVGGMTADLTWIGDGWCDDGAFGMYLDCEAFNYDDGDCGHCVDQDANNYGELAACAYDVATCDVEGACNFGEAGDCTFAAEGLDCDGNQLDCVGGMTADLTWIGDGWCDDGAFWNVPRL